MLPEDNMQQLWTSLMTTANDSYSDIFFNIFGS